MGGYGMFRVSVSMFPDVAQDVAWLFAAAGVINVIYGAIVVMRQTDLKRLIAFSSVSHMGFVMIGLASVVGVGGTVSPLGLTGAAMQMFTHGTITGLLFLLVGMVYDKAHTRYIPDLGGLAKRMPFLAVALLVAGLASLGLPGTSGFVAELLIFLGAFKVFAVPTAIAVFGVVLAAAYILWTIQRVMFGPVKERFADITDVSRRPVRANRPAGDRHYRSGSLPVNNLQRLFQRRRANSPVAGASGAGAPALNQPSID